MSKYEEWFKKGCELLQKAEEVARMRDVMLVSADGKRAIYFPFPFNEKEIQSEIDQFRQQLETAKQKHEAREKQKGGTDNGRGTGRRNPAQDLRSIQEMAGRRDKRRQLQRESERH